MREILFRGKRADNEKWVIGYLSSKHTITITTPCGHTDEIVICADTVGQYTGLKDKNGKRIFEGDIVEGNCHSAWSHRMQRCDIAYGRDGFEARNHIDGVDSDYYTYRVLFSKDVVIIGNIHDNPELLEK